ncbi:MAG TPA: terminase [Allosphingosinicella sp.]|jgi:hypothetical protein
MTAPGLQHYSPADVERIRGLMTQDERDEMDRLLAMDPKLWRPQHGPQSRAYESRADIIGFGGSAGGGKTDLAAGLTLEEHKRTLYLRSEKNQTEGFAQRIEQILGSTKGYNSQKSSWRLPGRRLLELGGLENQGDEKRWQGRPHDLVILDEATEIREAQARFVMGWARTDDPEQRVRVLLPFNPPRTVEGRWVIRFFAPWLDDKHPNPAQDGELRWFTTVGGEDFEVSDNRQFVLVDGVACYDFDPADFKPEDILRPLSRTFFKSRVSDNRYYVNSDYMTQLQGLPEPLRSQMLYGDFQAGVEDPRDQVIPTAWIDAAMDRWQERERKGAMDSLGADIAAGGKDNMVIARRHGSWFDDLIRIPGKDIPQTRAGPIAASHILSARRDRAPVHIDVVGWGLSATNFLQENGVQTVPVNGAGKSFERTASPTAGPLGAFGSSLAFFNRRAEVIWRMREALDPTNPHCVDLPDDTELRSDLAAYRWSFTPNGIKIGGKDDMRKVLGRSPDAGDAVCLANMATMKTETLQAIQDHQEETYDRFSELDREFGRA